jgi:hypothetical protein
MERRGGARWDKYPVFRRTKKIQVQRLANLKAKWKTITVILVAIIASFSIGAFANQVKVLHTSDIGGNHVVVPAPELQIQNNFWKVNANQSLVVMVLLQVTTVGIAGSPIVNKVYQVVVQVSCLNSANVSYTCSTGRGIIPLPSNMNGTSAVLPVPLNPPIDPETTEIDDLSFIVTSSPNQFTTPGVIAVTPNATPTLDANGLGTLQLTLTSINGFAGTVSLMPISLDPGVMVTPQNVTLVAGATVDATLQVDASSSEPGNSLITVNLGCASCPSGPTRFFTVYWWTYWPGPLNCAFYPYVTITASPSFLNLIQYTPPGSVVVTITARSRCGFTGTVHFSSPTVSPSNGPSAYFYPPTFNPGQCSIWVSGGTCSVTETVNDSNGALGTYTVTTTAAEGLFGPAKATYTVNYYVLP